MDQDRPHRRRRRRRHRNRSGEDYISGLPDELLHSILLRLGSTRAAARTSVLSRRWRPVWRHLPELVFGNGSHDAPPPTPASFLDAVDSALAAYAAPTIQGLVIVLSTAAAGLGVPAGRVAPWLRFAAERVAVELVIFVPPPPMHRHQTWPVVDWEDDLLELPACEEAVLELPACERAKTMALRLKQHWRLRLPPAGMFTALTSLTILFASMEGSEVTALVCTRCPCLRNLRLSLTLVDASNVSIRSDSLQSLSFCVRKTRRLEVVTPRLENLFVGDYIDEARISAPKLEGIFWRATPYDPHHHRFDDVGRRLQLLDIGDCFITMASLMQRFDEVHELKLSIPQENRCWSQCPCLQESRSANGIALSSLEEVEITSHKSSQEQLLEFVEQLLSRCNAAVLKKLVINYTTFFAPSRTKVACEKIRRLCHPNTEFEFYEFSYGECVRFY
uniref:F-box domain-containing protein n=1 Tax=Setaria italica TaxID=4555 RepID=K3ZLQ0_SETIT